MNLLLIDIPTKNPQENFEIEELMLGIKDEYYVLRFWVNDPCVVVGRSQDINCEVNVKWIKKNKIPVFKRFTGGGTVYHDHGNLNITFSKEKTPPLCSVSIMKENEFVTKLLITAIKKDGIKLEADNRNNIYVNNKKLLGSAAALRDGKYFYQASLLVNANISHVYNSINWNPHYSRLRKKVVESQRSKVVNLQDVYPISIQEIKKLILEKVQNDLMIRKTMVLKKKNDIYQFIKRCE